MGSAGFWLEGVARAARRRAIRSAGVLGGAEVVGGGVIGSSIAYHVARQGHSVLVVERGAIAAEPAASWASAGGIRRQDQDPAEAALAVEATARWPTLAAELEADLQYRQGGHLLLAESDAERLQRGPRQR